MQFFLIIFVVLSINSLLAQPIFSYLSALTKSDPERINLQKVLFKIDKLLNKNAIGEEEYNQVLKNIISDVQQIKKKGEHPKTTFYKIAEYFVQYSGFVPAGLDNKWDINLFTSFLKNKSGSCLPFSLLYLIISDKLNLPVYASLSPEHIFIKFDDGKIRFNVETVYFELNQLIYEPGTFVTNNMYMKAFKIPYMSVKNGYFLQKLNKKQVIGVYLNNIGALILQDALLKSDYKQFKNQTNFAKKILLFSLKFYLGNFSTFLNLANLNVIWHFNKEQASKFLKSAKKILVNKKTRVLQAEFLIRIKSPYFIEYIKRINIPVNLKHILKTKFYLYTGDFKKAKNFSARLLQKSPYNQEYLGYYIYSLIRSNELVMATMLLKNFKEAYGSYITGFIYAVDQIVNIYRGSEFLNKRDMIIAVESYIDSINWQNLLNKFIFTEYYNILKDEGKIADVLKNYLSFFDYK